MINKIQQHSVLVVAVLGVVTAVLGVVAAYSRIEVTDVTQERNDVQGRATDLQSQQVDLQAELEKAQAENADLRARLDAGSAGSSGAGVPVSDAQYRQLTVPLPADGQEFLSLDRGEVTDECCSGDFTYDRNSETNIPELRGDVAYSTEVSSAAVSEDECAQSVKTSPTITAIRSLRRGTLICAISDGGTSLLRISSTPSRTGTLKISQTFWPS